MHEYEIYNTNEDKNTLFKFDKTFLKGHIESLMAVASVTY